MMENPEERIRELESSLARCLKEAEEWMYECNGGRPEDMSGYDGWADKARRLLSGHSRDE